MHGLAHSHSCVTTLSAQWNTSLSETNTSEEVEPTHRKFSNGICLRLKTDRRDWFHRTHLRLKWGGPKREIKIRMLFIGHRTGQRCPFWVLCQSTLDISFELSVLLLGPPRVFFVQLKRRGCITIVFTLLYVSGKIYATSPFSFLLYFRIWRERNSPRNLEFGQEIWFVLFFDNIKTLFHLICLKIVKNLLLKGI